MQRIRNNILLVPIGRLHSSNNGFRLLPERLRRNVELIVIVGEARRAIVDVNNIYVK